MIEGLGRNDAPHWRGAIVGGIWQSVRMVAAGSVMVDDTFITPRLEDNTAKVQVVLDNTETKAREVEVEVLIHPAKSDQVVVREKAKVNLRPGRNNAEWTLTIPDARYWSPAEATSLTS